MPRDERDPQVELIRRYARILRSAPAEAWKPRTAPAAQMAGPARFGRQAATLRGTERERTGARSA